MPKRRRASTTTEARPPAGFPTPRQTPHCSRGSPLPNFTWASADEVWESMLRKDEAYPRNPLMLHRHPGLQARMRSILLGWLTEVCELYRLHRETNYLALDFIDRYLSVQSSVPKQSLQLIGITCLFIAAKIEEIYPPKLAEFAYVTDGACTEEEIMIKELVILKALNWHLHPMTINSWLTVYMQVYAVLEKENKGDRKNKRRKLSKDSEDSEEDQFMIPAYSSHFFAQIAHLVDLCVLDVSSLRFSYSVLAAAALYHFTSEETVIQCTKLSLNRVRDCIVWMTPFALAIREDGFDNPKLQRTADSETLPNIQSHTADLKLLEKAHLKQSEMEAKNVATPEKGSNTSPSSSPVSPTVLTPPKSHL